VRCEGRLESHTLSVMERGAAVFVTSACGRQRSMRCGRPWVELLTMPLSQQQVVSGHGCCLLFLVLAAAVSSLFLLLHSPLWSGWCVLVWWSLSPLSLTRISTMFACRQQSRAEGGGQAETGGWTPATV
jgi:hypothetical protein